MKTGKVELGASEALVLLNRSPAVAFVPSVFQSGKLYEFAADELRFLSAFVEKNGDIVQASAKTGWSVGKAERFFKKPLVVEFLQEKAKEMALKRGATAEWFWANVVLCVEGKKKLDRVQMEALKEAGARIVPKVERVQHEFTDDEYIFAVREEGRDS